MLLATRPDWLVLVGDVNSTLACALVASKLEEETGCRIAHIEAGLRSRDWRMPEEINRVLTDRLSDLLLTPSRDAHPDLIAEGIEEEQIGYREMVSLVDGAAVALTDSGGLQEETTALGVPCVTLREQTERPITVTEATNRRAPWPLTAEGVYASFRQAVSEGRAEPRQRCPEGWDGRAGERIEWALSATTR